MLLAIVGAKVEFSMRTTELRAGFEVTECDLKAAERYRGATLVKTTPGKSSTALVFV